MEGITGILTDLFIIFAAAKLAGGFFQKFDKPAIVGEVLVGILIGPYALGWVGTADNSLVHLFGSQASADESLALVLNVMAELGVILLLFFVGLETRVSELLEVKGRGIWVGVLGIIFPFLFGYAFLQFSGRGNLEAAFVATAMVSTSIGITARVLGDIGVIGSRESRIILGAAVIDDVLGLLLLSFVSNMGSAINYWELLLTAGLVAAFVVFASLIGTRIVRRYSIHLNRIPIKNAPLMVTIMLMLGLSALAGWIGLAAIIGAFLAGLMLAEAKEQYELEKQALPIYEFLTPFFFVVTGTKVNLAVFQDLSVLALALGITLLAIVGKLLAGGLASRGLPRRSALIIGTGMAPRGEVGLVVASIGSSLGAISTDMFSAVVFMSLATTLIVPPILTRLYRKTTSKDELTARTPVQEVS